MKKLIDEVISRKWILIASMSIGALLIITGLFRGILESRQVQVEYLSNDEEVSKEKIFVDVGGGVENPGVYELISGSRMKDALMAAGGLSSAADRELIAKMFNLAQVLKDGQKIYVPIIGKSDTALGYAGLENTKGIININTASEKELDTLEGIGPTRAKAIIDNRPYSSVDELVEKKVISGSILEKIREEISAY